MRRKSQNIHINTSKEHFSIPEMLFKFSKEQSAPEIGIE